YHPGHAWAMPEGDGVVRVGMDDFAHKLLGAAEAVRLPEVGSRLQQGGKGWQMKVRSQPIDMLSPVGGEVTAVNDYAIENPDRLGEDPYGKDWLVKIHVAETTSAFKNLLSGRFARAWMDATVSALRQKMGRNLGTLLQDGGLPVSGFAVTLSPDDWTKIAEDFFLCKPEGADPGP
ncbi:MAG: glycine cleavage system protein H, partial [Candidatus Krumholzibacteria bacterium]|nr:glycine cleavage system protein H [Candidatus Krumholzibacteria bacterium]